MLLSVESQPRPPKGPGSSLGDDPEPPGVLTPGQLLPHHSHLHCGAALLGTCPDEGALGAPPTLTGQGFLIPVGWAQPSSVRSSSRAGGAAFTARPGGDHTCRPNPGPRRGTNTVATISGGFLVCQQPCRAPTGPAVPQTARQTHGFAVGSARCLNGSSESPLSLAWVVALPMGLWAVQSDTPRPQP